jgi:hypothetical protein
LYQPIEIDEQVRFLVRLKNTRGFMPRDVKTLTITAYDSIKILNGDVGNLRVSQAAIEFDVLVPSKKVMDLCLQKLIEGLGQPLTVRELDLPSEISTPARAVENGIQLFNEERYWESHESLEAAWRIATGVEREILQAIILLSACFVHLQKDESDTALSIMKRANFKLPQEGTFYGIDLGKLKQRVHQFLSEDHPAFFKLPVKASG